MLTVLGLGVMAMTFVLLRRRGLHGGAAYGLAAMVALGGVGLADRVQAAAYDRHNITASGPVVITADVGTSGGYELFNTLSSDVQILSISFSDPDYVVASGSECKVNALVSAGTFCDLEYVMMV